MRISKKLLLIVSSVFLLAGCNENEQCPEQEQCPACEECEECPTPHEHTFDTKWETNELSHWHKATCEHTDLVSEFGNHTFNDEGKCTVCEFVKPSPAHEHTFSDTWSKDETNHWHAATCEHTDLTKGFAAHNFGDDNICDDCGYEKPAPAHVHTYDVEHWETNSTHHWHNATCEHTGLASDLGEHSYNSDGECVVCGHLKEIEMFGFSFKSDYCDLNNNEIYQEGEEVELTLTLKEAYKSTLTIPSEIEVYSNGVLLNKGTDYTYETENNVGTLSLIVNGNIVVQAFRNNDESAFKVNEEEFAYAINGSNFDYLQYDLYYVQYSSYTMIMLDYLIEYCPTIVYKAYANLTSTKSGSYLNYDYSYTEKEDTTYTEYKYTNSDQKWVKNDSTEQNFNDNKVINLTMFPILGSKFVLTYDTIKDHYNSVTNAYELEMDINNYHVKFEISFYDGKIINIAYSDDSDYGFFANIDLGYEEKDVIIPEDVKPHAHTFATEWSNDSTHHWHEPTCEHKDEKCDYGEHTFDQTGACSVCGYVQEKLYPVITKITTTNTHAGSSNVISREWSEDYSSVISTLGEVVPFTDYVYFNENGFMTEQGVVKEEEFVPDFKYTYENGLLVNTIYYDDGKPSSKKVYTYDEETGKITSLKDYNIIDENEVLFKEETYEYTDTGWTRLIDEYEEGVVSSHIKDEWLFSEYEGNRKETYFRTIGEDNIKKLGYVLYNELNQIIEVEDTCYGLDSSYYEYTYLTYTDDGNLSSLTNIDDHGFRQRKLYSYDDNGFITKMEIFDYNSSSSEYDILNSGYDYEVDSNGTIIKATEFAMNDGDKEIKSVTEFEIEYASVKFTEDLAQFLSETKGTYNYLDMNLLPIIG